MSDGGDAGDAGGPLLRAALAIPPAVLEDVLGSPGRRGGGAAAADLMLFQHFAQRHSIALVPSGKMRRFNRQPNVELMSV